MTDKPITLTAFETAARAHYGNALQAEYDSLARMLNRALPHLPSGTRQAMADGLADSAARLENARDIRAEWHSACADPTAEADNDLLYQEPALANIPDENPDREFDTYAACQGSPLSLAEECERA